MSLRTLASVLLCLALSSGSARAADTRAFVLTTDFSSGGLSAIDLATRAVSPDVATLYSDAVARWDHGLIFVVNRLGQDNVQVIDPNAGYATVQQFSVENGTNPQDIAFASPTHAYVSRLAASSLLIVNPVSGASLGTISLGAFADADGNPEAARMIVAGPFLFVALQRLANFAPTDTSLVVVVDTRADTVYDVDRVRPGKQAIVLAGRNPNTTFAYDPSGPRLLIGCVGQYGALDGGIEGIALDDALNFHSEGFVVTEAALGGDVADVVWSKPARSYAIVSDASFDAHLVAWSAVTHLKLGTLFSPGGFSLSDCELNDRGELYVCCSSFSVPGVYVYRAGADTLLAGPLNVGLPPAQVLFDRAATVAAVEPAAPRITSVRISAPSPNPSRSMTRITLATGSEAGLLDLAVFDMAGRRIRTIKRVEAPPEFFSTNVWNHADDLGVRVPAGVYLVRASVAGHSDAKKIVVLE